MASRHRTDSEESSESSGWSCVVCCQKVPGPSRRGIFAIGACEHPVCYECSTKMRVLCQQTECSICRQEIKQVIFTRDRHAKYTERNSEKYIYINNDYNIVFENEDALQAYGKLLEQKCRVCRSTFPSFSALEKHLQDVHELLFCDLCVKHLKIFSHERKYYNKRDLVRHRKYGDPDDRSHRGHPLCKFCEIRFLDDDDLHRHLRRDHFFCHFCDPAGLNKFYENYSILKEHFRNDHFLCEEGPCAEEQFTTAFKSEIDYQAHRAYVHCHTKSESKSARTLTLDFLMRPQRARQAAHSGKTSYTANQNNQGGGRQRSRPNASASLNVIDVVDEDPFAYSASGTTQEVPRPEDFPVLSTNSVPSASGVNAPTRTQTKQRSMFSSCVGGGIGAFGGANEEFPALSNTPMPIPRTISEHSSMSSVAARFNSGRTASKVVHKNSAPQSKVAVTSATNGSLLPSKQTKANGIFSAQNDDFPALPMQPKNGKSGAKKKKKGSAVKPEVKQPAQKSVNQAVATEKPEKNSTPKSSASKSTAPVASTEDFPSLQDSLSNSSEATNSSIASKPPPGLTKPEVKSKPLNGSTPPPGYSSNGISSPYEISLSSVAQQVIKSSSLESEEKDKNDRQYVPPVDFDERNRSLVKEVSLLLKKKFDAFKHISKEFRQQKITGEEYWKECLNLFGKNNLPKIFPELLVLLPDIVKQNELLAHYEAYQKSLKGAVPKRTNSSMGLWILKPDYEFDFLVCPTCHQILAKKDGSYHMTVHENSKTTKS